MRIVDICVGCSFVLKYTGYISTTPYFEEARTAVSYHGVWVLYNQSPINPPPRATSVATYPLQRPFFCCTHHFVWEVSGKHSYRLCPPSPLPKHELSANGALPRKAETPPHLPGQIPMSFKDIEILYSASKHGGRLYSVRCCFLAASVGSPRLGLLVLNHNPLTMDRSLPSLPQHCSWNVAQIDCRLSLQSMSIGLLCMSHGHGQS